jgi:hypothetical protein
VIERQTYDRRGHELISPDAFRDRLAAPLAGRVLVIAQWSGPRYRSIHQPPRRPRAEHHQLVEGLILLGVAPVLHALADNATGEEVEAYPRCHLVGTAPQQVAGRDADLRLASAVRISAIRAGVLRCSRIAQAERYSAPHGSGTA